MCSNPFLMLACAVFIVLNTFLSQFCIACMFAAIGEWIIDEGYKKEIYGGKHDFSTSQEPH